MAGDTMGGMGGADQSVNLAEVVSALQALTQAVYTLQQTFTTTFPFGGVIAGAAGAATGTYLAFIGPDGTTYKVALLAES